jgi:hypothetical protein
MPDEPETPPAAPRRRLELASHISQIVAAIAVVVSLIYVGLQLQQNTAQLRRAENNATETQFQAIRLMITQNHDVAELLTAGLTGGQHLDPADELRLETFLSEFTWATFHIWDRAQQGFLDKDEFTRGGAPNLARMLCTARGGAWWTISKRQFVAGFAREVDKALADMPREACPDYAEPQPRVANG